MAVERKDPLPRGRYWIVIRASERKQWEAWATAHRDTIHTVVADPLRDGGLMGNQLAELFIANPVAVAAMAALGGSDIGDWILFEVKQPTRWVGLGYPTIVQPWENPESPDQVVTAPTTETSEEMTERLANKAIWVGAAVLVGLFLFNKLTR